MPRVTFQSLCHLTSKCKRPVTGFVLIPTNGDRSKKREVPFSSIELEDMKKFKPGEEMAWDPYIVKLRVGNPT